MEDKITTTTISALRDFIINACNLNLAYEICGFVGFNEESNQYVATIENNQASNPSEFFSISPVSYLKFKNNHSIIGVFHSHVAGDESPSEFDIKMSESCCLPFIIYSLNSKKFSIYEPKTPDYDVNRLTGIKEKFL